MKIPAQYSALLYAACMSLVMVFIMSGFITMMNTGVDSTYHLRWAAAFVSAWPVAFVSILFFAGKVRRLVTWLTAPKK